MKKTMNIRLGLWVLATLLSGCGGDTHSGSDPAADVRDPFVWDIPNAVALPRIPAANPMTEAGFQLGRHLFYDPRLSANGNIACASCHHQDKAFADGRVTPAGTYGALHPRNAQALGNTSWYSTFNWANPVIVTLEHQVRGPLFGDDPHEHGLSEANQDAILAMVAADPVYRSLLAAAYPGQPETLNYYRHLFPALATFVRGMTSFDSPYDRYLLGQLQALSASAQRGLALFSSNELQCSACHRPDHFLTDSHASQQAGSYSVGFHNNASVWRYEFPNTGRHEATGDEEHFGQFRTPSLKNIALTAPYMHDGSQPDLRSVIATYAAGGLDQTNKDPRITGFTLTEAETADLLAFLCSLTDTAFITNPRYSNPWPDDEGNPRPLPADPGVPAQCL